MKRRKLLVLAGTLAPLALCSRHAMAHHGWSSFDETRPLYVAGKVKSVKWQNPHAEIVITMAPDAILPADLARRNPPAQTSASVNAAKVLAAAALPKRRGDWTIELSPMTRIQSWKVPEPKVGDTVAAICYSFKDEKGEAFARVEYLIIGDRMFGLRSNPL